MQIAGYRMTTWDWVIAPIVLLLNVAAWFPLIQTGSAVALFVILGVIFFLPVAIIATLDFLADLGPWTSRAISRTVKVFLAGLLVIGVNIAVVVMLLLTTNLLSAPSGETEEPAEETVTAWHALVDQSSAHA